MVKEDETLEFPSHGAAILPSVKVDSYSVELSDSDGFLGDKANKGAFSDLLEKWRKPLREFGQDPLGSKPAEEIGNEKLAHILGEGDVEAAGVVQSAIEEFAQQLSAVIQRLLRLKDWRETECLVIGGGFSGSRIGELAIGRSEVLLKAKGIDIDLELIRSDPDEAGLCGAIHLLPRWMLKGHEGILAVDVGGTNIRAGVVAFNNKSLRQFEMPKVVKSKLWRHADENIKRDDAVITLADMLKDLAAWAKRDSLSLAPVIGIGCPGVIHEDGTIERGAQNLPGNWESRLFKLPAFIQEHMPEIGKHETLVIMHNDAVVQGLSELPNMVKRHRWGALTIGTGLGNARFTNRHVEECV
jgi:hypothetical protein